jgi:two-component system, OmpR family, response regulator MtrA
LSKKVLIVDDDVVWLTLAQAWLKIAGYDVVTRGGSIGTVGAVRELKPDFVLFDINMPGLNGDVLASLVARDSAKDGPGIVLCSGNELSETQGRAQSVGALGAVKKVSNRLQFVAEVERLFALKEPRPE